MELAPKSGQLRAAPNECIALHEAAEHEEQPEAHGCSGLCPKVAVANCGWPPPGQISRTLRSPMLALRALFARLKGVGKLVNLRLRDTAAQAGAPELREGR